MEEIEEGIACVQLVSQYSEDENHHGEEIRSITRISAENACNRLVSVLCTNEGKSDGFRPT